MVILGCSTSIHIMFLFFPLFRGFLCYFFVPLLFCLLFNLNFVYVYDLIISIYFICYYFLFPFFLLFILVNFNH